MNEFVHQRRAALMLRGGREEGGICVWHWNAHRGRSCVVTSIEADDASRDATRPPSAPESAG